jgi:hypothetical protein
MTMKLTRWPRYFTVVWIAFAGAILQARSPAWLDPLLKTDVTTLAGRARVVRLADMGEARCDANGRVRETYRGAVRVMSDEGRHEAECDLPYNADTAQVIDARAWIVSPDGKRTDQYVLRDFADTAEAFNGIFWAQARRLRFNGAGNIGVNGVLAWEIEVESQTSVFDFGWEFPERTPTVLTSYEVVPPPGGQLVWKATGSHVPVATAGATPQSLHWEEHDFRPLPRVDRPTGFLATPRRVAVRVISANGEGANRSWGDVAKLTSSLMDPRIGASSPALQEKATALVSGKTERWDRIRALSEFMQKEITYLSVVVDTDCLAGYRPHNAAEVFQNRFGDCKDKTGLLVAMLRAIGENAYPVLVFSGDPRAVQADWPAPYFNHVIVGLPADDAVPASWPVVDAGAVGKLVLFDPTSTFDPLGTLPYSDEGGHGLVVAPATTALVTIPATSNHEEFRADVRVDDQGGMVASGARTLRGGRAAVEHGYREREGREFTHTLESELHEVITSIRSLDWSDTWDARTAEWKVTLNLQADHHATRNGSLLIVPLRLVARPRLSPWKTRVEGVVWSTGENTTSETRFSFPALAEITEVPDAWHEENRWISVSVEFERAGGDLICRTHVSRPPAFLDREAYEQVRAVLQKLENAQRSPVVLTFKPAKLAGN